MTDLKNEPLTPDEFEKLPDKLIKDEYWNVVREGTVHKEYSAENGWNETLKTIYPDDNCHVIGFIGTLTGIRLGAKCADMIENKGKYE